MSRPRNPRRAWGPDGRTLVPLIPGRYKDSRQALAWTPERRAELSAMAKDDGRGSKGKALQYKRRADRSPS